MGTLMTTKFGSIATLAGGADMVPTRTKNFKNAGNVLRQIYLAISSNQHSSRNSILSVGPRKLNLEFWGTQGAQLRN